MKMAHVPAEVPMRIWRRVLVTLLLVMMLAAVAPLGADSDKFPVPAPHAMVVSSNELGSNHAPYQ
jgi:hypothetical protein